MRMRWQTWLIWTFALAILAALSLLLDFGHVEPNPKPAENTVPGATQDSVVSNPLHQESPESSRSPSREKHDFTEQIRATMRESDPERRLASLLNLADLVDLREIPALLASLGDQDLITDFGMRLLERWIAANPSSAANWVAKLNSKPTKAKLLDTVAAAWWKRDPHAAISWVMTLPEPDDQLRLWIEMDYERTPPSGPRPDQSPRVTAEIDQRLKVNAQSAATWIASLPDGSERESAIEYLASKWVYQNMNAAVTWVHTLPNERERAIGFTAILRRLPARER